jgi:2-C-methyl-D-erythritol 4-phosphate cytidylyltransferase/2-C-methyl-D-erythritol 2,4-cyclodiphosphate synthase
MPIRPHVVALIAAGGRGARLGAGVPKQLLMLGDRSILQCSVEALLASDRIDELVVVLPGDLVADPPGFLLHAAKPVTVVAGGPRRQDSVALGFAAVAERADLVVIHDAARPFVSAEVIDRTIGAAIETGAALAALPSRDTVKLAAEHGDSDHPLVWKTLPRERVYLAQTPQVFRRDVLRAAIAAGAAGVIGTDEAALAEAAGHAVRLVAGDPANFKITTAEDLAVARALVGRGAGSRTAMRVGTGYDLHRLVSGRRLMLGGVEVPFEKGALGHSDADVLAHAITDAVLGAVAAGDIGRHFPDTDPRWKDAPSMAMLAHAVGLAGQAGFRVNNVDAVVVTERPRLAPHIDAIRATLAVTLGVEPSCVSVKGKTNEGAGEIGRGEAIAAHAVALLVEIGP